MASTSLHWHSRTPLRVRVLGVLLLMVVLLVWRVLWHHWQLPLWQYLALAILSVLFVYHRYYRKPVTIERLHYDEQSAQFSLQTEAHRSAQPVHVLCVWQHPFAITLKLQCALSQRTQQLTFWRGSLTASCWRKLHIYLGRYQLQYQFFDLKDEQ